MSDIEIIQGCLEGDQRSYKRLYEKYISYAYGICNRYSIHQSDVKDIIQNIFSSVFHSLKNYDKEKSLFKTWFTRICINHILSFKKKQERKIQTQSFDEILEQDRIYGQESKIESSINKEFILEVIRKMPDNYQHVFNLFILDGFSHEEIATKLDITTSSSRVILNRARKWVKKALANQLIT